MTIQNFVCSTKHIQMVVTSISPKLWISMWCVYTVLFGLDLFNSIKSDEPQPSSHLRVESLKYSTARTQHEKSKHKGRHTFPSKNSWNMPGGNCCKLFKKDQPLLQMFRYNNFANIQVTFDQPPFASIQITFASIFSNVSLFYTPNLKSRKALEHLE